MKRLGRAPSACSRAASRAVAPVSWARTGRDLERHVAVDAAGPIEDRPEHVGGSAQVVERELEECLLGARPAGRGRPDRLVVGGGASDRAIVDRRVGGQAGDREVAGVPLQGPAGQEIAGDVVEPQALARPMQESRRVHRLSSCEACAAARAAAGCRVERLTPSGCHHSRALPPSRRHAVSAGPVGDTITFRPSRRAAVRKAASNSARPNRCVTSEETSIRPARTRAIARG
jgi:hypothetical protein